MLAISLRLTTAVCGCQNVIRHRPNYKIIIVVYTNGCTKWRKIKATLSLRVTTAHAL
jgi:hypothetical protein